MIPYTLSKKYDTKITTYPNEEFDYMTTLLTSENFSLDYLDNTGNEKRDVKKYLKKHAKNIDISPQIQFITSLSVLLQIK